MRTERTAETVIVAASDLLATETRCAMTDAAVPMSSAAETGCALMDAATFIPSLMALTLNVSRFRKTRDSWRLITPRVTREQKRPAFASRARKAREVDAFVRSSHNEDRAACCAGALPRLRVLSARAPTLQSWIAGQPGAPREP